MKLKYIFLAFVSIITLSSCSDTDTTVAETVPTYDMSGFAKGADVSWVTEMEAAGTKFYDANGRETECLKLLRSMGVNSNPNRVITPIFNTQGARRVTNSPSFRLGMK